METLNIRTPPPENGAADNLTTLSLLRNRQYFIFFSSRTISLLGDNIHRIALIALVYQNTHSVAAIGTTLFFLLIPKVVFGVASGVLVDRWDRKKIMIATDLYRFIAVASIPFLPSQKLLYLVLMTLSAVESFYNTARVSSLPEILEQQEELLYGNSLIQTSSTLLLIIGPAIGGLMVASMGTTFAFIIDSTTFLVAGLLLVLLKLPTRKIPEIRMTLRVAFKQIGEGFKHIFKNNVVFFVTFISVFALGSVFLTSSLTLVFADRFFAPQGYNATKIFGYINSINGIGSFIGALLVPRISKLLSIRKMIFLGLVLTSLDLFCFSFSTSLPLIMIAVLISSLSFVTTTVPLFTLLQLNVVDEIRGRVLAFFNVILVLVTSLTVSTGGWLAEIAGVKLVYLVAGVACLLAVVSGRLLSGSKEI